MPMFRREAPAGAPASGTSAAAASGAGDLAAGRRPAATVVAPGTRIQGTVSGTTELQVLGEVEGEVRVDALVVIGGGGAVAGPVHGKVVRVVGQVSGDVTAGDLVEVAASGSLEGDIAAPRVVISEGAFFRGNIEMKGDKSREPRRAQQGPPNPQGPQAQQTPQTPQVGKGGSEAARSVAEARSQ
jgi:cytoskeletal protein CcmA (bactofilin family)